jgi:DNA-binding transcriptional LysR family regulator
MEIRQVEYALAVVDEGGFTRAASALHVSQPSLSQGVGNLERDLGLPLFHRLGRRVSLTAAGDAFVGPARQLLRDADIIRASVAAVRGLRAGRLDLVALPTLAVEPSARLVGQFRRHHPRVDVRLVEPEDADAVGALVRDGRCEIGLTELPAADDLVAIELADQEILAICPPGTRLTRRGTLRLRRLAELPLITTPSGTSTRRLVDRALATAAINARVAVETGQREAILPLVLAGAGTSFLPSPLAAQAANQGAVVASLDPPLHRRIGLVHRSGPLTPAARAFVGLAIGQPGQEGQELEPS